MKKDFQSSSTDAKGTGQGTGLKQQQKHLVLETGERAALGRKGLMVPETGKNQPEGP